MPPVARQLAQLGLVSEVVGRRAHCRARRCRDAAAGAHVAQHRPQRRDAGAAGDEHEALFRRIGREGEACRADLRHRPARRARACRCDPAPPSAIDANQQLEAVVAHRVFGSRGDRVRLARRVPCVAIRTACPAAYGNGSPFRSIRTMRARGVARHTSRIGRVSIAR